MRECVFSFFCIIVWESGWKSLKEGLEDINSF